MKPKVLHVITVYNGRSFVPAAIKSAVEMDQSFATIDVLVLDDASPEPGWSEQLAMVCDQYGAQYYCTPQNLGIPGNVSLGLLASIKRKYDYVTINNSDVLFPKNLITVMIDALAQDEKIGSVTAWSNNVSIYSIPNADPDKYLSNQETVDFVSEALNSKYGSTVFDGPAGISFCIMMPVSVVKNVGVMDPIFGRGYCEETDWSLRSLALGYRVCICPGTFVYHQGRGSNIEAGLVSGAHTTVPENEVIIDKRYPDFRSQCAAFESTGIMPRLKSEAIDHLIEKAAKAYGYIIVPGWRPCGQSEYESAMRVEIIPVEGKPTTRFSYKGFEQHWPLDGAGSLEKIMARFDGRDLKFNSFEVLAGNEFSGECYPRLVW